MVPVCWKLIPPKEFGTISASRYTDFYTEWIDYRMKLVEDRAKYLRNLVREDQKDGKLFEKEKVMKSLKCLYIQIIRKAIFNTYNIGPIKSLESA